MASKVIFALLAIFAVALAQEATAPVPQAGTDAATVDATLSVALTISPPDVAAAIQTIKDNAGAIAEYIANAINRISLDAKGPIDKLDSFLQNLREELENAKDKVAEDVRLAVQAATDKIRELIALKRALLEQAIAAAVQQLDAASQRARELAARITEFLKSAFDRLRNAVSSSKVLLSTFKNRILAAITAAQNYLTSLDVQAAIESLAAKLEGQTVAFGDILKGLATELAASGQAAAAAAFSALGNLYNTATGLLGGYFSLGGVSLGGSGSVGGSIGGSGSVGGSIGGSGSVGGSIGVTAA